METIIFYTEMDKVIGCTHGNNIIGEPFCDVCQQQCGVCSFRGQLKNEVQQRVNNERSLKITFIKLYLEKLLRSF